MKGQVDLLYFHIFLHNFSVLGPIFKMFVDNNIKIKFPIVLGILYTIFFDCQSVSHLHTKYKYYNKKNTWVRFHDFFLKNSVIDFNKCSLILLCCILIHDFLFFATNGCWHSLYPIKNIYSTYLYHINLAVLYLPRKIDILIPDFHIL